MPGSVAIFGGLRYHGRQTAMMISVFSFGASWIAYALAFYAVVSTMPQSFHSTYHESVFKVAFLVGLLIMGMLRVVRVANFKVHWIGLIVLTAAVNWGLILLTNNSSEDYVITGRSAPIIAAVVMGVFAVAFDTLKNRMLSNVRL